jgi:soluble lytic murein transglycosylase
VLALIALLAAQTPEVFDEAASGALLETPVAADYFAEGPFKPVRRVLEGGNADEAVRLLKQLLREHPSAPERPQARFLLGLSLIRAEQYEEAARLFDELALSYPALKEDHLYFRGQALYLWGSYLDAAAALSAVDPSGPRGDEAKRLRAWALLNATDFSRLVRLLEAELKQRGRLDAELTYLLGRARHKTGDVLGAFRSFREVWRESATAELSGPALAYLAELRIGDKPMVPYDEAKVVAAVANKLRSPSDFDDTMGVLEKRLPKGALLAEVAFSRGRVFAKKGRFRMAEEAYRRAQSLAPVEESELRAKAALFEARAKERLGDEASALTIYQMVSERFADRPDSEEALFYAAEIELRSRRYAEARGKCEALLLKNPVTPFRRQCLWSVGWGHYRLGQYDRAREFFTALNKMDLPADLEGASSYWLGRSFMTLKQPAEAERILKRIIDRYPLSYYAALAEGQLALAYVEPDLPKGPKAADEGPLPKALIAIEEYVRLGLKDRARKALQIYEQGVRATGKPITEIAYHAMARFYDEIGQNTEARRLREEGAREYPTSLGTEAFVAAARRAHPLKFETEIRAAAGEFDVPESLLFGLIRTESGFRSDAVSAMDAYGLAQLILPTAKTVGARIKAGRITKNRLLGDPAVNARLGAAYLKELLERYENSEPLALAAYNAGPAAVDAWQKRRVRKIEGVEGRGVGLLPGPDELAEEIPVAETRAFVKVVLARARGYARLYPRAAKQDAPPPVPELSAYAEPDHLPAPPRSESELTPGAMVGGAIELSADLVLR